MKNINEKIEEAYDGWRETWDLDDMYPREIYEAGFRHGVDIWGVNEADMRRIVACVNACTGIPHEKLESWLNPPANQLGAPHGTWANQLAETGRKQIELIEMLDTLCNGIAWNIEHHPDVMNESDNEALRAARSLLEKFGAAA